MHSSYTHTDIVDVLADDRSEPSTRFAAAFSESVGSFRISKADDPTNADMPDAFDAERASEMLVSTLFDVMRDTRLEAIAPRIAWGIVHAFHKVAGQLDDEADRAARAVKELIRNADGSEVGTVELEEAQTICQSLDEARDAVACMRDRAAEIFRIETGRPWSSPRVSLVSSKRTASVIAATDFLAARRQSRIEARAPQGPIVVASGGQQWSDAALLWSALDTIRARVPAMILATTAQERGVDAITAAWAASRGVKLIAFTLDRKLGKRAGFVRNETLLALDPVEAVVCEGTGIQSHLARLVRAKGVPAHFFRVADQRADEPRG
jgi:hypothetical protein